MIMSYRKHLMTSDEPPSELYKANEVGTDCISRQEATDALRKMQTYKLFSGDDMLLIDQAGAMTELMQLPPIQSEIIRCKDCKYARLTNDGSCKYCDIWFPDEAEYIDGDYYCASAERKSNG